MIMVDKKLVDSKSRTSSYGSSNSSPEEPYRVYKKNIDASRVPRIFVKFDDDDGSDDDHEEGEEDGIYMYPGDDDELLSMLGKSLSDLSCACDLGLPVLHHVEVNADSCTVEECLELLKKIGCDNHRFISCSVDSASLFHADLKKDEAAKLKGLNEIRRVYAHGKSGDWRSIE